MLDWLWRRLGMHRHKWITTFQDGPKHVQMCLACGEYRSSMYDMLYGDTYWLRGDHWSQYG